MSRPQIPGHIIAQRGRPVTFLDGTKATLVCTFSSLMRIEDDFGSVADALGETQRGMTGPAFTSVASIMAACLQHEVPVDDVRLDDPQTLRMMLDPMLFDDYAAAVGEAIGAAFPDEEGDDDKAGDDAADPTQDSRGESGGTSPA